MPKVDGARRFEVDPRHTKECRRRIEGEMSTDPILSQRLAATQKRMGKYLESFKDGIAID